MTFTATVLLRGLPVTVKAPANVPGVAAVVAARVRVTVQVALGVQDGGWDSVAVTPGREPATVKFTDVGVPAVSVAVMVDGTPAPPAVTVTLSGFGASE